MTGVDNRLQPDIPTHRRTLIELEDPAVAELLQILVLMAVPATILLTIRHMNSRDARKNPSTPTPKHPTADATANADSVTRKR